MAKTIKIIGVGAGDPSHVTMQAVEALNTVDVFFLMEKGPSKDELLALRREVCRRYIRPDRTYRFAEGTTPERDRGAADYLAAVDDLNDRKGAAVERLIAEEMADGECAGYLAWGDPALYDSTIRIIRTIAERGRHDIVWEVIPGVSSLQALTARHKVTLNSIGRPVLITTGRRLAADGFPAGTDSVAVMLDAENSFLAFRDDPSVEIYWGAYVGAANEILIAGPVAEVADEIVRRRAEARAANGWIMDSYLLRRAARP